MVDAFPSYEKNRKNAQAESDIEWVKSFVVGIRNIRGEMDIPPSKKLPVLLANASSQDIERLAKTQDYLVLLAKLDGITVLGKSDKAPACATAIVGEMEIMIPMAGLIDKDAELKRLNKSAEKLENDVKRTQGKLSNENFVGKAPEAVINKERAKLEDAQMQLSKIQEQIETIKAL